MKNCLLLMSTKILRYLFSLLFGIVFIHDVMQGGIFWSRSGLLFSLLWFFIILIEWQTLYVFKRKSLKKSSLKYLGPLMCWSLFCYYPPILKFCMCNGKPSIYNDNNHYIPSLMWYFGASTHIKKKAKHTASSFCLLFITKMRQW